MVICQFSMRDPANSYLKVSAYSRTIPHIEDTHVVRAHLNATYVVHVMESDRRPKKLLSFAVLLHSCTAGRK
jgi:hypothetical protein